MANTMPYPPPSGNSHRMTLQDSTHAKTCYFYKDGDYKFSAIKVAVNSRRYRRIDALCSELSSKIGGLPYGVRGIFTPRGRDVIRSIESLRDDGHYICSTFRHRAEGLDISRVAPPALWRYAKPSSGQRDLNMLLTDPDFDDAPRIKQARYVREQRMAYAYNRSLPKKVTVLRNGDPTQRHILLINRRTAQTFDQILSDLSEMFGNAIRRLYTMEGRKVINLTQLFNGPEVLVAAGKEPFKSMLGVVFEPTPPPAGPPRSRMGGADFVSHKLKDRRDRMMKTRGQWKVWVTTNELSTAGTTAQVTITVYGHKGSTTPLPLGYGDGQHFQNGHIDEFDLNVGNIGEIYKIRIGHDNTGDFPSWLVDEVRIKDTDTGEELVFPVKRWLSREEDDFETCRELPVVRRGEPQLPVIKYEVTVVTADLWNAGTDANVYLTVYGDRGDTGVRQLYSNNKDSVFKKGQTNKFTLEAVSLGKLKRVIVGHDGTNAGEGWFLDRIMIQEPDAKPHEVYTFYCGRWLDEGEDDGKIVRELKVQDEYMDDILAKRNWEYEKWKFESKNQVMFFSLVTGKALRIKSDGTVNGLGDATDPGAIFIVSSKKPMVRIFTSLLNTNFHLAIDNGKVVGHGRGGPYCEFRLHVQNDRTVMIEGVKSPLQFISLLESGKLGDPRGVLDKEPGKRFHVYCKGMLRHRGVIMLRTSNTQAVSVDHDLSVFATGKCNRAAHFRVHKVESGGVRMFESMVNPGKYLRLYDGKIDCQGTRDEYCHFVVEKHRDKGYITVQSKKQRGIFLGMTPRGEVRPTVDTGVNNVWLIPEVVEFGVPKQSLTDDKLIPISERDMEEAITSHRSPEPKKPSKQEITAGDWKVTLNTLENLEHGDVALVVYGDKGHTDPIKLVPPVKNGPAFRAGSTDEFKANLLKVGEVYKMRLELVPNNNSRTPSWKVGQVKMLDLNSKNEHVFNFNRWLSRHEEDGEIMRELPVMKKGKEVLPVRKYEVRIYTGKEENAGTRARVYFNMFGEHGDIGKHFLLKSNNKIPFQQGRVDVFEIEAVSLGDLTQCLIGHDGTKAGDGWYLESIVVKETKNATWEYIFPCNRWLDSGREDQKIERLLQVKETDSKPTSEILPGVVEKEKTGPPAEEKPKDGDWQLLISTGRDSDMGCTDTVIMYAYGNKGCVGPVLIGHGEDGVFQPGNMNEFKINIDPAKAGKLYKIRVGLAEQTFGAQWYLDKVVMVDLVSRQTFKFDVHRWLSRKHEDCDVWRELPVAWPGEKLLPVLEYQLLVHTGDVDNAETEADIYITMHGERGDSGKRRLYKSQSGGKPFRKGKVDTFTLEAVSLGEVKKLVVGHEETQAGDGWYLVEITVAESDKTDSPQVYFPCNRWLDTGKDDHKTIVELKPGKKPKESNGQYQLFVKTAADSSPANGGKVSIVAYGSKGHSKDVELFAPNRHAQLFESGNIDEFEVALGEIGEIYKLRVNREDTQGWKAWHLEEMKLKDRSTGQTWVFVFNRWFSRDMDDHDLVRELPALKDNKPVLPVCHYEVTTFTGDHWAGGTDATVHITLVGTKGDSGKRVLYTSPGNVSAFKVGGEDSFELEAVDLGELQSVIICHDGKGHGAGWFLDKVTVKVTGGDGGRYVFPCFRWLDMGEDDGKTERELRHIDIPDLLQISPMNSRNESKGDWQVYVKTSDMDGAATCAQVYLTVYGTKGVSRPLPLGEGRPNSDDFWRGKESMFSVNVGKIGEIKKIRVEHDTRNPDPSWHVDYIRMVDTVTEEELFFPLNRWLGEDKEDGQLYRECPVISPDVAPVPVLRYLIAVQTGRQRSAGTSEGWITVNLTGRNGDTGQQLLQHPLSNPADKMSAGKLDIYMLEAVSVGTLQSLRLVYERKGKVSDKKWFVERVTVMESLGALEEAVFDFNCWLDADGDNAKVVPLTDMQVASSVTDDVAYRLLGHTTPESQGQWDVTVWTGKGSDSGTKDLVMMVLYGTNGQTEAKQINKDNAFNPGSVVHVQIDAGSIGPLFKIRLMFGDPTGNSSWFLERLKLKDRDTGQEFLFDHNAKIISSPQSPDGTTELPAIRPDIPPLPETTYLISLSTGRQPRAETDAEIFCTLIGQWGDTGERILSASKSHKQPFRSGQTDQFEVKTLYLGNVRKLMIGHNENGRGCGWFCHQVTVWALDAPAPDKKPEVVFSCNRWLDSGCDDRRLVRELMPTGQIFPSEAVADRSGSRGNWCCTVKMASEDKLDASLKALTLPENVSITVYGSKGVRGPIDLKGSSRDLFLLGQTDKFDDIQLGNLGEIKKLRVCAGHEDDDNPVWMVQQVILEDVDTHDKVRFDFSQWVGEVGGDIRHELPALHSGELSPPVVQYEVRVHTGNGPSAGTNSNVFINLYGKNGDSGRRRLVNSEKHHNPFQTGQMDIFIVDAVDLGDLEKVVVTKGPGSPWHLSQIMVRAGLYAPLTHVFIWSNMVGDKANHSEEVEIMIPVISSWPAPVAIPAEQADDLPASSGHWSVEIETGEKGSSGDVSDLVLVMCGDKGESSPLQFNSSRDKPFQPRQKDTAEINLPQDVGDLFKVRVGFANIRQQKSLHIVKLKFEDVDTRDNFSYNLNAVVHVDKISDGWTEFPVVWPAVHVLPVLKYKIEVVTGGVPNAETQADIFIQLHGRMGSTGKRHLKKSLTHDKMFQQNQTDVFEIEAVSLLSVDKVDIGHHRTDAGDGWFCKRVVVTPQGEEECVFECNRWLDGGEDDGRIERTLHLMDNPLPTPTSEVGLPLVSARDNSPVKETPHQKPAEKAHKWRVWTTTGSAPGQGTNSPVVVVVYGDKGHSGPMVIGESKDEDFYLTEGLTQEFELGTDVNIGKPYKVRVGFLAEGNEHTWYSNFNHSPQWFLERLKVQNETNGKQYVFEAKQWIGVTEERDHWREFPVYTVKEEDMLPIHNYSVEVFTGDRFGAGTDANVYLEICGEHGESGWRHLHGTKTPGKMFEREMRDLFFIEAVDLGKLTKVRICHDGYGPGAGWFLDRVTIKESEGADEKHVFNCERWLDEGEDDGLLEMELPLTGVVMEGPPPSDVAPKVEAWQVLVMTSAEEDSGTDARVLLTVVGDKGSSDRMPLGAPNQGFFQTGHTDHFNIQLKPHEIGKIQKIRLEHDNSGTEAGWRVESVEMVNEQTQEKLHFPVDRWLSFSEKHGDIVFEAPAEWPNEKPLERRRYRVKTVTETEAEAGTNADVHITLVGQNGDSGRRELKQNLEEVTPFQAGQTDSFLVEAVDLGHLEKIIIGMNGSGFGSSWKLQCVIVRVSEKENYVFPWGKWLNDEHPDAEIVLEQVVVDEDAMMGPADSTRDSNLDTARDSNPAVSARNDENDDDHHRGPRSLRVH